MSELQDALNKIMSDPEAMRQVQSLGEQLGLGSKPAQPPPPAPPPAAQPGGELMSSLTKLAPLMRSAQSDETAALLDALRPFLSGEKLERLNHAQRLVGLIRMIPLLRDSGLFL